MARTNSLASGVSPATATLTAAVLFVAAGTALATPEIASVTRGNVSVAQQGTLTQITASNGSIINYNSFNIPRGTTVQFIQPSATSRVLNRINSGSPSRIDGTLTANGRVYLVNPSGVIFGRNSVVNAAAVYASSGNITDSDFTAGRDRFITSGGGVINNGRINAHTVGLSGPVVENNGSIVSDRGIVVMAAGDQVTMRPEGSRVAVTVTGHGSVINGEATAVGNDSREPGRTSPVSMMAGDVYGYAVRNSGSIQGGQVTLQGTQRNSVVTSSGTIDVSNANGQGGRVEMTGDRVGVMGGRINADGSSGGGDIRIGGDILGSGPVANANQTYIAPGAVISADATNQGTGGIVVLYGIDSLQVGASVTARGGVNGGSGGVIETSTQGTMQLAALPNAAARVAGANEGTWIIDPTDILIDDSNAGDPLSDPFTSSGGSTVTIGAQAIEAVLNAGNNISIITGAGGAQAGDITIDGSIDINPASGTPTLTLNALNNIVFTSSGQIELVGGNATVNLVAGNNVSVVGNFGGGVTSGAIVNSATGTVGSPATLTLNITAPSDATFINIGGGQIINTVDNSTAAIALTLNGGDAGGSGFQPIVQWDSPADFGNAGSVNLVCKHGPDLRWHERRHSRV
jgi:trimeric autotransporter adhesin